MLIEMSSCPFCDGGHNSPCFARYTDGYKCFTCGVWKQADRSFITAPTVDNKVILPEHEVNPKKFRVDSLKWLYQYYITDDIIRKNYIMEAHDGSILLPAIIDNHIKFYVRRWLGHKKIRHIGKKPMYIIGQGDTLVVVEDYISAIRVAKHTSTLCLFGTKCSKYTINHILTHYNKIILWLDGDKPGQDASRMLQSYIRTAHYWIKKRRTFTKFDLNMSNIVSEKDPKCYSSVDIKRRLDRCR